MEQLIVGAGWFIGELVNRLLAEGWNVAPGCLSISGESDCKTPWLAVVVQHPEDKPLSDKSKQLLNEYRQGGDFIKSAR